MKYKALIHCVIQNHSITAYDYTVILSNDNILYSEDKKAQYFRIGRLASGNANYGVIKKKQRWLPWLKRKPLIYV